MTTGFPLVRIAGVRAYFDAYAVELEKAVASLDRERLERAMGLIEGIIAAGNMLYVCGNGGSAAVSNHMTCDVLKGAQSDTDLRPRIISLSTQVELLTAIANDIEYADVFVYQLRTLARTGDGLITISSSGESENVVRALVWARTKGLATVALTGFSGGRCADLAEVDLHVAAENYGVVEDVHQSIMHVIAQYLRMSRMPDALIGERRF